MPLWLIISGCLVIIGLILFIYKQCQKTDDQGNQLYMRELEPIDDTVNSNKLQTHNYKYEQKQFNNPSQISQRSEIRQQSLMNSKIQQQQSKLITNQPRFKADQQRNMLVQKTINYLYDNSWRKRNIGENYKYFLGGYYQTQDLFSEYNVKKLMSKQNLKMICSGYRAVRGDGNCFYTSFGFQFLEILLLKYEDDQFYKFLEDNQIPFQIKLKTDNIISEYEQQELRNEFFFRLERLRLIQDSEVRKQRLYDEFRAYQKENDEIDGCFYGLSTIFFRNLAYKIVEKNEQIQEKSNLFLWEVECNENEIVIASFSTYLKLLIQLILFVNGDSKVIEYGREYQINKIILLIRPGHYNIGIKDD